MIADSSSPQYLKRRRFTSADPMEFQDAKAKLNAAKEKYGREIIVFETVSSSSSSSGVLESEESDEFFDLTPDDYHRIFAKKKEDNYLKTRKIREAEEVARRAKTTMAVIRTRFPDNTTMQATFHSLEKVQSLFDLLSKVIAQPNLPYHLFTTPPKKLIRDTSLDFRSVGFIPGAIVYFSHDIPKGNGDSEVATSGPFLSDEIMSLKGLNLIVEQAGQTKPEQPESVIPETEVPSAQPVVEEESKKSAGKKPVKPKWLRM